MRHQCKGLVISALAAAQPRYGIGIASVTSEMKAANPFDSDYCAPQQQLGSSLNRVAICARNRIAQRLQPHCRTASRASERLRMKTAVGGVVVFTLALRAQGKPRHARIGAVVWNRLNDRKSRTAMGAVGKGILVTPVGCILRLGKT
jgi:hypothetical protein